ncbi:MAG: CsiV family protein [Halioglobus sp.]
MPLRYYRLIRPLSLALGLFAATAYAQDERWYQVELLIFSHEGGATAEQWEPLPELDYPNTARFLMYPQQIESRQQQHDGASEVDAFGRQFLRYTPQDLDNEQAVPDIPVAGTSASAPQVAPGAEAAIAITPTPFTALAKKSAEFYGKAAYMQRSGRYKTLFHETWVQPVRGKSTAVPIIIDRSGDSGNWPQLQGSIKLHIARYLHIETNLWLNTQGQYLPGEWRMPAPPLGPLSVIIEEPEEEPADPYFLNQEPTPLPGETAVSAEGMLAEETGPVYPWRHAVLLQQKRRMRSQEVHYIDHPLLGVVIKFMPLDEEQLQAMADAEFNSKSSQ